MRNEIKKDFANAPLEEILYECAIMRGVQSLQHRTIHEFNWFVKECVFGKLKEKYKDKMSFMNDSRENVMRKWGLLFYDYCYEEYSSIDEL